MLKYGVSPLNIGLKTYITHVTAESTYSTRDLDEEISRWELCEILACSQANGQTINRVMRAIRDTEECGGEESRAQ